MPYTLHILQPRARPHAWFHAPGSPSLLVSGLAPLLAVRCLQAADDSHHALIVGNHEALADAESVGLRVHASLLPPLHAQSRMGPALRMQLRGMIPREPATIVCWGGSVRTAKGLVRRCAASAPRSTWLWVDVDAGSVQRMHPRVDDEAAEPVALSLPTPAELAAALPAPREQWRVGGDEAARFTRRIALLADPAAPGNAVSMTALSSVLHAGNLLHSCMIPRHASRYVEASRRVVLDRGLVAQVLHTSEPLLHWLHTCAAAAVFAVEQGSHRWALACLVHACLARRVLPVLCEGDAQVLASIGCDVSNARLAQADAPAQFGRAMLSMLLAHSEPRPVPASSARAFIDVWRDAATRSVSAPVFA